MLLDWVMEICEEFLTITEEDSQQVNSILTERRPKLLVDAKAIRSRIVPFLEQVIHHAEQADDYDLKCQVVATINKLYKLAEKSGIPPEMLEGHHEEDYDDFDYEKL